MGIDVKVLRDLRPPMFARLSDEDLQALAARLATVSYKAGELVFSRGDASGSLFIIASGRLRISLSTPEGREIAFRVAGPGETVGEIGALDGGERSADAVAIEPVRALALTRADLDRLLDNCRTLSRALIVWLCKRLRETTDQLEGVALLDIEQRLARFLVTLARDRAPEGDGRTRVALPVSQAEVAHLLGASRPKINVALGVFESEGLIERRGAAILADVARLAERAGDAAR